MFIDMNNTIKEKKEKEDIRKTKMLNFRFPVQLHEKLKKIAHGKYKTMSEYVREIIICSMEAEQKKIDKKE